MPSRELNVVQVCAKAVPQYNGLQHTRTIVGKNHRMIHPKQFIAKDYSGYIDQLY